MEKGDPTRIAIRSFIIVCPPPKPLAPESSSRPTMSGGLSRTGIQLEDRPKTNTSTPASWTQTGSKLSGMGTAPTDPPEPELDKETKRILDERLKTLDEDRTTARPAKEVVAELRAELKQK